MLAQDRIHFGVPACEGVRSEVAFRGAKRAFVVTSKSLKRKTSAVTAATRLVADSVVGVFDECVEHTPRDGVIELARQVREAKADLIVTIGGGTAIDTVKVALVCLAQGITTIEQLDDWHVRVDAQGRRVVPLVGRPPLRQIAVPATLSAAE